MNHDETDALLRRWYAGQTTEAEQQRLRRAMTGGATPRTADELLFAGLQALAEERHPGSSRPRGRRMRLVAAATAAAAVLAVGLLLGSLQRKPYCYIDGVAIYDPEQALAAADCLKGLDALASAEQLFEQLMLSNQ